MSPDRFDHLLSLVEPAITKQNMSTTCFGAKTKDYT